MSFLRRDKRKTGRILVVEDDWDILEVLKLMLEDEGHQVVTAKHGKAALAVAAVKSFDLVVMDISMPEMSGIEVAKALRAAPRTADLYIVIHTGLDEHWVRERFSDYDVFLTKAEDADVLVEEIARLLAQPRLPGGGRAVTQVAGSFTAEDVVLAQRALRASMGLGPEAYALLPFLGMLADEIGQLRKMGRSNDEIAELLTAALAKPVSVAAVESFAVSTKAGR
jgi:CheY-like chemotaxis protein